MAALARQQWRAGIRIGVSDRLDTLKNKTAGYVAGRFAKSINVEKRIRPQR